MSSLRQCLFDLDQQKYVTVYCGNPRYSWSSVGCISLSGRRPRYCDLLLLDLGGHLAFVRAFAAIGRGLGEAGIWARIDALHALQQSDPQKYASRGVQSELQGLYAKLYGGQSVVGSEGRRL